MLSALIVALIASALPMHATAQENVTRIAAASSMRFVLDDLISAYEKATGDDSVQSVYGSSGNLYRQILQGAPYDMFLSADSRYTAELEVNGKALHTSLFALGSLVLYSPAAAPNESLLDKMINALRSGVVAEQRQKIAIANPGHAPFGKAAMEVLQSFDLWEKSQPHLIIADNVSQAAQFARTGAVDYAFVARSLVHNLPGMYTEIEQENYLPLELTLAVLSESPSADDFQVFIRKPQAYDSYHKYKLRTPVPAMHNSTGNK